MHPAIALLLIPLAAANVLAPADVPVECATICGPIVELSAKCDVDFMELRRRSLDDGNKQKRDNDNKDDDDRDDVDNKEAIAQDEGNAELILLPEQPATVTTTVTITQPRNTERSTTTTTTTTTTPRTTQTSDEVHTGGTRTMTYTMTVPWSAIETDTDLNTDPSTDISADRTTPTNTATGTSTSSWGAPSMYPSDAVHKKKMDAGGEDCLCSPAAVGFDAGTVVGLCAGCIRIAGDGGGAINDIMTRCNFSELVYTPDLDRVVDNIIIGSALRLRISSWTVLWVLGIIYI